MTEENDSIGYCPRKFNKVWYSQDKSICYSNSMDFIGRHLAAVGCLFCCGKPQRSYIEMNKSELRAWIIKLIKENKLYKFYKSKVWTDKKEKVLEEFHNECMWCKENGKISKATEVHHIQYVKKHPEFALDEFYTYKGKQYRNLVPLCHDCHDKAHERMKYKKQKQFNEERW